MIADEFKAAEDQIDDLISKLIRMNSCLAASFNSHNIYAVTTSNKLIRKYLYRIIIALPDGIPMSIFDVSSDDIIDLAGTLEGFVRRIEDYRNLPEEEKPYLCNVFIDIRNGEFIERSTSQHRTGAD